MRASLIEHMQTDRMMRLSCIWCAVPMLLLLFPGIMLAEVLPPQAPSDSPAEVADYYRSNTDEIRIGLAFSFLGVLFMLTFAAAIAAQTQRIRGVPFVLQYLQTMAFSAGALVFVIPWVCWQTAAFRSGREDTEIALLHDLGWICFTFYYISFTTWLLAIGATILCDRAEPPVYPRWLGYLTILVGASFFPDNLIVFFKDGPFAWDGLFTYWIPFVDYGIWVVIFLAFTVKAINREAIKEAEQPVEGPPQPLAEASGT